LPEWPQHELLAHEKELLGFYVTGHPLTPFAPILEKYAVHTPANWRPCQSRHDAHRRPGGRVQKGISKKSGKPYAMVTLEDLEGTVQILCLNENYDKFINLLAPKALLVTGEVNTRRGQAQDFPAGNHPLEDAPQKYTKQVHLRLQMAHLTAGRFGGRARTRRGASRQMPVILCLKWPGGETIFIENATKNTASSRRWICKKPWTNAFRRRNVLPNVGGLLLMRKTMS
jgi:DNA polymerase-3 subunit alpha